MKSSIAKNYEQNGSFPLLCASFLSSFFLRKLERIGHDDPPGYLLAGDEPVQVLAEAYRHKERAYGDEGAEDAL